MFFIVAGVRILTGPMRWKEFFFFAFLLFCFVFFFVFSQVYQCYGLLEVFFVFLFCFCFSICTLVRTKVSFYTFTTVNKGCPTLLSSENCTRKGGCIL